MTTRGEWSPTRCPPPGPRTPSRPGGGGALICACERRGPGLRRVRRHPQPGLRGQGLRDASDEQGLPAHLEAGAPLPKAGRYDVLLLDLWRPDRERRVRLSGLQADSLPEERQGPLRRRLAVPQVEGALLPARDAVAP